MPAPGRIFYKDTLKTRSENLRKHSVQVGTFDSIFLAKRIDVAAKDNRVSTFFFEKKFPQRIEYDKTANFAVGTKP